MEELGFEREAAEFTCKVGGLGLERETSQEQETAGWAWTDNQMRGYPDDYVTMTTGNQDKPMV